MVAAGDETAQADPTVVPFHPAVRFHNRLFPTTGDGAPTVPKVGDRPARFRSYLLDAILIYGRKIMSISIAHDPPPQAVLAPVPVSLAVMGNSSPRAGYKQVFACPIICQGAAGGIITPSLDKVMAKWFWSALG